MCRVAGAFLLPRDVVFDERRAAVAMSRRKFLSQWALDKRTAYRILDLGSPAS